MSIPNVAARVGIVGTGVAGLRAADILLRHGVEVIMFEARDRLGGRVAQSDHLGHLVDLGPNWIHGTRNNPMLAVAEQTNTVTDCLSEEQAVYGSTGVSLPALEVSETAKTFWSIIADASKYSNEHWRDTSPQRSLMDFVLDRSHDKYGDMPESEACRKRQMLEQEAEMWGGFVGGPTRRQSLKFFWLEECIGGENAFVASTYRNILARVAAPAVAAATVKLNTQVAAIRTGYGGKRASVRLDMADGTSEVFDDVVVTVPLGCLKNNTTLFHPPLPRRLVKAIDSVGYGNLDKVYITFARAYWDEERDKQFASSDKLGENDDAHAKASPTEANTARRHPPFVYWLRPDYAAATNPQRWSQQAMNLAGLPAPHAQPTLLYYVFGDCAKHIATIASTGGEAALLEFFKPYFSRLPGYDAEDATCQATSALATAWTSDELAGYGSYSNFQVGLEGGDEDVECMREGMPERHVYLAGEHTAPFSALGTVTGAYWAGEEVGKRIVQSQEARCRKAEVSL